MNLIKVSAVILVLISNYSAAFDKGDLFFRTKPDTLQFVSGY